MFANTQRQSVKFLTSRWQSLHYYSIYTEKKRDSWFRDSNALIIVLIKQDYGPGMIPHTDVSNGLFDSLNHFPPSKTRLNDQNFCLVVFQ